MCLFCDIVSKKIPATLLYEDEQCMIFKDIEPRSIGHCLLIPKTHCTHILDMSNQTYLHLHNTLKVFIESYLKQLNADGVRIQMNNGDSAGQIVPHAHIHIIPSYKTAVLTD